MTAAARSNARLRRENWVRVEQSTLCPTVRNVCQPPKSTGHPRRNRILLRFHL